MPESKLLQTKEMHFILRVVGIVAKDRKSLQNGHCLGTVLFKSVFRVKRSKKAWTRENMPYFIKFLELAGSICFSMG